MPAWFRAAERDIMRITIAVLVLCAGTVGAQMPLPAFGSTFTSASLTRGLWFQTPVGFTITGLRVPDESNHGLQNVAVYQLAGQPPAYPATAQGGIRFYQGGVASSLVIPANISFNPNDWVGVLGACGDSTTMRNSYALPTGPFQSSILGQPVTLTRFITQTNIVTNQGVAAYSESPTGQIGRVEIWVNGVTIQGAGAGTPGSAMNFGLSAPNDAGLPYQVATSLGTGPTPIGQRSLGLTLDSLFAASVSGNLPTVFVNYAGTIGASGNASAALNIPPFAVLKGITLHTAFVTFSGAAPLGVKSISNTFTFQIV